MITPPLRKTPTAERLALDLDGAVGIVLAAGGGEAVANIVSLPAGPTGKAKKHLAAVHYEPISLMCGASTPATLYQWIKQALDGTATAHSGAMLTLDPFANVLSRIDFFDAQIGQIEFPALDAATRDRAAIAVTLNPTVTRLHRKLNSTVGSVKTPPVWQRNSFRLRMSGLEDACAHVTTIAPLVIKFANTVVLPGDQRDLTPTGSYDPPNLVVTLPEAAADPFYDWHEDFMIKGNCSEDHEKTGTLEYFGVDKQRALFTLTFTGLGIFRLAPELPTAGTSARRVRAELYCQGIGFSFDPLIVG